MRKRREATQEQLAKYKVWQETCQKCGKRDEKCIYGEGAKLLCRDCDPTQYHNKILARLPQADPMQEYHWAEYLEGIYGLE